MQVLIGRRGRLLVVLLSVAGLFASCGIATGGQGKELTNAGCTYFGNPERTSARDKFVIRQPGQYCLTEDLHARIEFADHPAEDTMIEIWSGDVVLDLQGHTLGRGKIFKNTGRLGIDIVDPGRTVKGIGLAQNIVIKNGVLQDFETGIYFGFGRSRFLDTPTFDPKTNTYHFPANNITLENITFKNNKKDFDIRVPPERGK